MPQPSDPTKAFHLTWDAWNRLVKVSETVDYGRADGGRVCLRRREPPYPEDDLCGGRTERNAAFLPERKTRYWKSGWIRATLPTSNTSGACAISTISSSATATATTMPTDGRLWQEESGLDQRHYAIQDGNWNVVAVVDVSGGVAERYTYSAYGKVEVREDDFDPKTSNFIDWTVLYTGRDLDMETGLQYSRARYYGADLGRFISRDPIGYKGRDENLYRYVGNNSTTRIDPNGMYERSPGIKDCSEIYDLKRMADLAIGYAADLIHDLNNARNKIRQCRRNPFTPSLDRLYGKAENYHNEYLNTCQKIKKILDCFSELAGPWQPGAQVVFDALQLLHKQYCDPPKPLPKPIDIPVPEDPIIVECPKPSCDIQGELTCPDLRPVVGGVAAVGCGYIIYRCVRMVPSVVIPPAWPTIIPNAACP